jgi:hypothetical protein
MKANQICHFQTCFRIKEKSSATYEDVVKIVYEWLNGKEDLSNTLGLERFKSGMSIQKLPKTRSAIRTIMFKETTRLSWAMRLEETDKELGARRFWYSDIGLSQSSGEIVLSTRIHYAKNKQDLGLDVTPPDANVPRFIRKILECDWKVYSGTEKFRLSAMPVELPLGFGKGLAEWITSERRLHPIIVFNGDSRIMQEEARFLASKLVGKCQVLRIPESRDLIEEIKCYLKPELHVSRDYFRVYFPTRGDEIKSQQHRWYCPAHDQYPSIRSGIINGLLRNFQLVEADCVETCADVVARETTANLAEFRKKNPILRAELESFSQMLADAHTERDEQRIFANTMAVEVDALEDEIANLKREVFRQKTRVAELEVLARTPDTEKIMTQLPETLEEVVKEFAPRVVGRIVFSEEALKSARAYRKFEAVSKAWKMLSDMNSILFEAKFNPPKGFNKDLEGYFNAQSNFELSLTETGTTKGEAALMDQRRIVFEGNSFEVIPHLKWGGREPRLLRIYFAFDETARRIIIGHIGAHLPTAGTRKIS